MAEQPMQVSVKLWELQKKLGSGGFGEVLLYKNKETGEQIAIKRCKIDLEDKNRHRWQQEIDIMKKLDHENVVRALDVPDDLQDPIIPVLGMEYCQLGDLRKVLNMPDNVCGLDQGTVLTLAKHIASAVEYLHSKRVIHRDLKPENIIMQMNEDQKTMYKLIDLGYAKDMDQSSVARTFVGTLQYLAPELFTAKSYTNTADYWSLGVLLFESICGVRPFLPNIPPVQWHGTVGQKKENDICVYIDLAGNPVYSEHLHEPLQLSKKYQHMFEPFLRYLLQWDPTKRGGPVDPTTKRAQCFTFLESILNSKLVNVFCVNSQSVHSYQISESCSCQILKNVLAKDTGIPVDDQEILFPTGNPLDMGATVLQCWGGYDQCDMVVYLFHKSYLNTAPQQINIPERVEHLIQNQELFQIYGERKKAWGQALFLCAEMERSHNKLLDGARAAEISMLGNLSNLSRLSDYLKKMQGNLEGVLDFFRTSVRFDIETYQQQAGSGITSEKMHREWLESEKTVDKLLCKSKAEELDNNMLLLNTKISEIKRSPVIRQQTGLSTHIVQMTKLYMELKKKQKDDGRFIDSVKLVPLLKSCIDTRSKLTKDVLSHIQKILQIKQEIQDILRQMEVFIHIIHKNTAQIKSVQQQRQNDMWKLLRIVHQKLHRTSGEYQILKRTVSSVSDPASGAYSTHNERQDSLTLVNECDTNQSQFNEVFKACFMENEKTAAHAQSMDWSFINKS